MHFNIQRIVAGILGTLVSVKFLFWFFTPTEMIATGTIWFIIFLAYGIQRVEWTENGGSWFSGLCLGTFEYTYQQWRIYGIIPISPKITIKRQINISRITGLFIKSFIMSLIPFGGAVSKLFGKKK